MASWNPPVWVSAPILMPFIQTKLREFRTVLLHSVTALSRKSTFKPDKNREINSNSPDTVIGTKTCPTHNFYLSRIASIHEPISTFFLYLKIQMLASN